MHAIPLAGLVLGFVVGCARAQAGVAAAPCDPGLEVGDEAVPVFVRMRDQVFADAAAFPKFCSEHANSARSAVRAAMLADLQQRAAASWQGIAAVCTELRQQGHLHDIARFWIVNGFAARADGEAVRRLRRCAGVAFVHRQTEPGNGQQRPNPRKTRWLVAREADEQRALELLAARGEEGDLVRDGLTVPWNLERVRAPQAWELGATGQGVVVALCDSGVLCAPPLVHALWQNPGEQRNGRDDDGNGLVDDVFGWDFAGGSRFVVGEDGSSHGTMCGGIVAGRPWGEPKTLTGVAPRARLMVLRGMGRLLAYEYAAQMGADVMSMSYMWTERELGSYRGVFRTAHEHLAACGVVAVGGAGNFAKTQPAGRQITLPKDIPCVIAASGVGKDGQAPPFSSRGPCTWDDVPFFRDWPAAAPLPKPDVTACCIDLPVWNRVSSNEPGTRVLWQDDDGYGLVEGPRGNSLAGPHVAGVAALMLSANRELCAWRVKELMEATCQDLGEAGRDAVHGAGLLQADAAVRAAKACKVD